MDIAHRIFRASPVYELVPFDRLIAREQAAVAELARDPDFFGVVRPREGAGGTIKAVSRSVALLLYALQSPGIIPHRAVAGGDDSLVSAVWRLTLDGVLEMECNGAFVSGARALGSTATGGAPLGIVARLSHEALSLAARIDDDDPAELGERLYRFNRRPITPRWAARLRTPGDVLRFAGAAPGSETAATLDRHWKVRPVERGDPWLSWWPRDVSPGRGRMRTSTVTYKVYVSPRVEELSNALPRIVNVLADAGAPPFKIGASASGLLRPDKIVAYLPSRAVATRLAMALATALDGMPAQPVPFTCEIGNTGLVSLGIDPPAGRAMLAQVGRSWRQWVCRRLAAYLCAARRGGRIADADRFALERIALDGIDPSTWEPAEDVLRGFAAGSPA